MIVTVLAILETEFVPDRALAKVMNDRLQKLARELENVHLKSLSGYGFSPDDLIVYISYTAGYKIRYHVVNDVPADVEYFVAELCGRLGYMLWKRPLLKTVD